MTPQDTPPPLDLLPCPFCGSNAESHVFETEPRVWCTNTNCPCNDNSWSKEQWNQRVDQGNGVREALALCKTELGWLLKQFKATQGGSVDRAYQAACKALDASPSPSEAEQSKAPTPNPKAKDGEG